MNLINYATLEQAKKMKELGYPQDKTDCVWVFIPSYVEKRGKYKCNGWFLLPREDCWWSSESIRKYSKEISIPLTGRVSAPFITEWYAAPNAQEIKLFYHKADGYLLQYADANLEKHPRRIEICTIEEAQSKADAWIWEKENKNG